MLHAAHREGKQAGVTALGEFPRSGATTAAAMQGSIAQTVWQMQIAGQYAYRVAPSKD
jgi:hypothetical protein